MLCFKCPYIMLHGSWLIGIMCLFIHCLFCSMLSTFAWTAIFNDRCLIDARSLSALHITIHLKVGPVNGTIFTCGLCSFFRCRIQQWVVRCWKHFAGCKHCHVLNSHCELCRASDLSCDMVSTAYLVCAWMKGCSLFRSLNADDLWSRN